MESYKDWSYNDFLTFMLIYAASADLMIRDEEKEFINEKIGAGRLEALLEFFDANSDYENLQIIMSFKDKYYPTDEKKEQLLEDMKGVFMADNSSGILEENQLMMIRKVL